MRNNMMQSRRLARSLLILIAAALPARAGIVEVRALAEPRPFDMAWHPFAAEILPDGLAIVRGPAGKSVLRIEPDGRALDSAPQALGVDPIGIAPAADSWAVLSAAGTGRSVVHLLDRNLQRTFVTEVTGSPIRIEATPRALYVVTHHASGAASSLWLHVFLQNGERTAALRITDESQHLLATTTWGDDAVIAVAEGMGATRTVRLLRVAPHGGAVEDRTIVAPEAGWPLKLAAGHDRVLLAIGGDPMQLLWLAPDLSVIERSEMTYVVPGSLNDEPRHLIATSKGFFLSHHQRITSESERSFMAAFSPSGQLIEDVDFPPVTLMAGNNDHLLISWEPGTIRTGTNDPRHGVSQPVSLGSIPSSAGELRYALFGDTALVGWTEYPVTRLTRLPRSGETDREIVELARHVTWDWELSALDARRAAVLRLDSDSGDMVLRARIVDVDSMTASDEVELARTSSGRLLDAQWDGTDLMVAIADEWQITLLRFDCQLDPIGTPITIRTERHDEWISGINLEASGATRALFWSLDYECRLSACFPSPVAGGFALIGGDAVSEPVRFEGPFDSDAVAASGNGWYVARFSDGGDQPRLMRVDRSGMIHWDVPLQRPANERIDGLFEFPQGLFLTSDTQLVAIEMATPRYLWTVSPPSGQWREAQLLWPDRIIYLADDPATGEPRPWTARLETEPETDLAVDLGSDFTGASSRSVIATVTNDGQADARDVTIALSSAQLCASPRHACHFSFDKHLGTIRAGETVQFRLWQTAVDNQLRAIRASITSSTVDVNPGNDAVTLPRMAAEPPKRGVTRGRR